MASTAETNTDKLLSPEETKQVVVALSIAENDQGERGCKNRCIACCNSTCPPQGKFGNALTTAFLMVAIYGLFWSITGDMSIPGGKLFTLFLIFSVSYTCGQLVTLIHLPDLFGMIISGIALRNITAFKIEQSLDSEWSSLLRGTALAIILVRAGMGLDPKALRRLSFSVFRLAFTPCIVEIGCSAVMSHFVLGLPWNYALMLGSVLAAVSPAVVVPCLLNLGLQGYGTDKGIPTLVIAASSMDDVLAISAFGILVGITFSGGSILFIALKSPMEIAMAMTYSLVLGCLLWYVPPVQHKHKGLLRFLALLSCAVGGYFASERIGFEGAGPFAALLLGFTVQKKWRKEEEEQMAREDSKQNSVHQSFEIVWAVSKPFLFGLIGAEVSFDKIDLHLVGMGIAVLFVGLVFRMATTFLVVSGNDFNIWEKIFVTISWLPKATVQAAIGGVALDLVRKKGLPENDEQNALKILSVAVLSILITAPLGAILITNLGPKLLHKDQQPEQLAPNRPETLGEGPV